MKANRIVAAALLLYCGCGAGGTEGSGGATVSGPIVGATGTGGAGAFKPAGTGGAPGTMQHLPGGTGGKGTVNTPIGAGGMQAMPPGGGVMMGGASGMTGGGIAGWARACCPAECRRRISRPRPIRSFRNQG